MEFTIAGVSKLLISLVARDSNMALSLLRASSNIAFISEKTVVV